MDRNILEFISRLRKSGLRVSTSEAIDCLNALEAVIDDQSKKEIMRATLVKRIEDFEVFEKLYRMYYGEIMNCPEVSQLPEKPALANSGTKKWQSLFENIKQHNDAVLNEMIDASVNSLGTLKPGDAANLQRLVKRSQISMDFFMAENLLERSFWNMPYDEWLDAKRQFDHIKARIEEAIRKKVEEDLGSAGLEELLKQLNLQKKDFGELQEQELLQMEKRIALLGKRLASRLGRRRKYAKKGVFDLRRLLKKAMASPNLLPAEFYYIKNKPAKPKIVILCDISGSVAKYSRFMLQLIYILANKFTNIRAYVFVDGIAEVTETLKSNNWQTTFDKIFRESKCSITGYSDYGKVFERFSSQYINHIDNKTNIIILGDARNNHNSPAEASFQKIATKAKSILWLNPQSKNLWNQDDSVIGIYLKYTRHVEECRNLEQLENVARRIFA